MNIDEAIKIFKVELERLRKCDCPDIEILRAIQLGIEALKLKKKLMHLIAMGSSQDITDGLILKKLPSEKE